MNKFLGFIKKEKIMLIGIAAGIVFGLLYWRFAGCQSGTCQLKASPIYNILIGGAIGGLLFDILKQIKIKKR